MAELLHLQQPRQVLDEKGRSDTLDSWMWVICSATPGKPAAYFQYDVSHSSDVFKGIVGGYGGYLQTDGYASYQTKKQDYRFTLALCAAHLRRKFTDAQKAGSYVEDSPGYITLDRIITTIGKIYSIDKTHRLRWLDEKSISVGDVHLHDVGDDRHESVDTAPEI